MIKKTIKNFAGSMFLSWGKSELREFIKQLEEKKRCKIVDLGCGDGRLTKVFARKCKASFVVGVEAGAIRKKIINHKMKIISANLNKKLPLPSNTFDAVISHFSIEHLYDSGIFISETKRILRKGGYTVVATDNLSSWPNIIALLFGWQPFSTASGITERALGNPFALRSEQSLGSDCSELGELSHNKVMAYKMLIDAYKEFGFKIEKVIGVGYFPASGKIANILGSLDKRHSHFLILKARKV
jgi:SAM-dependent methyltransferase